MAGEGAGRRELAELVSDHLLGDVDRDEFPAVVDAERQTDELRQDRRAPRPGLDHFAAHGLARLLGLLDQAALDKGSLPNRTCHCLSPRQRVALRRRMMYLSVALFLRVFLPLVGLPHGVTGWRPPEVRPSPPPCGWSTGFMATPRTCGRRPSQRLRPALPIEMFM